MLSDSNWYKTVPAPTERRGENGFWSDADKLEAVQMWLVTGNLTTTAAALGIPKGTMERWRATKWFEETAQEIRTEGHITLSNKMKGIAAKAMDATLDRLEHGDWVFNQKTGKMDRKPVNMRDAHQAAISFSDRALKLEDKPHDDAAVQQVSDRLAALAEAFSQMAKKTRKIEVIDVEPTSANIAHTGNGHELIEGMEQGTETIEGNIPQEAQVLAEENREETQSLKID